MEKAKVAVGNFLSRDGKHDTTVHETVNPAVQNETITPTVHEHHQKAVDREIHQDHHHTSVQPVTAREVLPEQHTHTMGTTEHKHINHGSDSHVKERLAAEAAQFKNTRNVNETQHSHERGDTIAGEHVHHHVHETIQPVVQKEVIQPSVVHTTHAVHEVHHNEPKHHTASQLPAVSLDEFKHQGGSLSGREERSDAFEGEPKAVGGTLGGHGAHGTTSVTENDSARHGHHSTSGTTGHGNNTHTSGTSGLGSNTHTSGTHGLNNSTSTGSTGSSTGTSGTATGSKPSLLSKLNPLKDSDGDGKKGIMD